MNSLAAEKVTTYLAVAHAFTALSSTTFFRKCVSDAGLRQPGHSSLSLRQFLTHYIAPRCSYLDVVASPWRADRVHQLTREQKLCPQLSVTGASYSSWQMLHRSASSRRRRPGAMLGGGKSVGSGTSAERSSCWVDAEAMRNARSSRCVRERCRPPPRLPGPSRTGGHTARRA